MELSIRKAPPASGWWGEKSQGIRSLPSLVLTLRIVVIRPAYQVLLIEIKSEEPSRTDRLSQF